MNDLDVPHIGDDSPPPLPNGNSPSYTEKRAHQTWRRVSLSLFGIILTSLQWRWAVNHIYALSAMHNDAALTSFTSVTLGAMYVIGAIVVFLVTGLTFFSWTQSSSIATNLVSQITDAIKKK